MTLPASAFYKGDIVKYYNCKQCERNRLAAYRERRRYAVVGDKAGYCCPVCMVGIDMRMLYEEPGEGKTRYYDCACAAHCRLRHRQEVDPKTGMHYFPAQAQCKWCRVYACNALCKSSTTWSDYPKKLAIKTSTPPVVSFTKRPMAFDVDLMDAVIAEFATD
jgi:hypothetical protein